MQLVLRREARARIYETVKKNRIRTCVYFYFIGLLCNYSKPIDMTCNTKKTVCLIFNPKDRSKIVSANFPPFSIDNVPLLYVTEFKYLRTYNK
jgi:hypothetical protein